MRLLSKIRALRRRCELLQHQCEAKLAQLAREDDELSRVKDTLSLHKEGLSQLLETQRVSDSVLELDQLYTMLRKQAILRHQLQDLDLQVLQLEEKRQDVAGQRAARLGERLVWLRKDDKYQRWSTQVRDQNRLFRLRQDETEEEERITWKQ